MAAIGAAEVDWDTIVCDVPGVSRELYRRATWAKSDNAGNGWMGRQLHRHLLLAGLDDVQSEGFVVIITDANLALERIGRRRSLEGLRDAGHISLDECTQLIAAEVSAGDRGQYFAAFTLFLAHGCKPGR